MASILMASKPSSAKSSRVACRIAWWALVLRGRPTLRVSGPVALCSDWSGSSDCVVLLEVILRITLLLLFCIVLRSADSVKLNQRGRGRTAGVTSSQKPHQEDLPYTPLY